VNIVKRLTSLYWRPITNLQYHACSFWNDIQYL